MKKTITALTLISLSIGVGMTADVNISATDLTEGEYNYIAIPQGENSTVVIDGLKEDQSLASVKRLYIGESLTGGDYTYGNISISVDNLKITERLYSFPFMDGAGTVSMGDIVFNVGSNVSSVQTYLGGQSWYSGSKYIANSITGTFNGNNSAHATAGVMTGAGDSVSINNGVKFYMTDANAYIRWMYVGGYNQNSSVTNIKGGTWAEISDGSIGKNLTGSIAGGVYNYNGASSRIEGGTHITITGGSHGDVYGGDQVDGGSSSYIDNTHIVMTGGSASTIFGGSLLYANSNNISQIGDEGSSSNAIVIDFGGTASAARIVGGSYNDSNADGTSKATINGNIEINVNGGTVGDIIAGGMGENVFVNGNSTVNLSGPAVVSGDIYGCGVNGATLSGQSTLNIGTSSQAYTGNGTVKAADFDKINVYKDANITFDGIVATNDAKMQICRGYAGDSTATITVKNAKYNNLTGDYPTRAPFDMAFINISDNSILNVESSEFNVNDISASTGAFINGSVWSGVANNSVVNINSVSFADNNITATKTADNSNTGIQYGMIYGNTVNVDASEFTGNKISSVSEVEGVGTSLYGGLIGAKNLSITGSKFAGNEAAQTSSGATGLNIYGGLLWSSTGKTLTIKSSEFSGNKSVASCGITGGVIFENGGITEISDTSFNGNSAIAQGYKSRGGAVANYNGVMTLNNVSFDGNYAETASSTEFAQGGALYARNYSDGKSTTLNNVVFSNNSVKNGMGGAIFVEGSNITINATQNAIMSGNVAMDREGNVSDANGGFLYLENYNGTRPASATFNIGQNATYIVGSGISGYDSIASGDSSAVITKEGLGSLTVNGSMDYFTGTLNVNEGVMNANSGLGASAISIASGAILEVRVNGQNALSNSALTSATYSNSGTLAISAKAGLAAGDYTVSAGNITDYGNVAVFGGTLNGNIFTAADTNAISLDTAVEPIVVSDNGRVAVVTDDSVAKIEMAFNSQEAVVNKVETVTDDLLSVVNPEEVSIVEAYSFDVAMNEEDTVLLSFLVGDSSLTVEDFVIFHRGETGEWEQANDIYSLAYDGEYLSFIVSHFSDYGYAAIPEPATYALLFGIAALAIAVRRRRK